MAHQRTARLGCINIGTSGEAVTHPLTQLCTHLHAFNTTPTRSTLQQHLSFKMFPNNNSTGATSDFSIDDFYFHDYLFEGTNWEPSNSTAQNTGFEQLASLSTAELEQLCMAPDLGSQMDTVIDSNGFDMSE